jgi:hypothetical protein
VGRAGDNERAVARGLAKTGRLVTAAGLIMVAAFSGFVAGSIVGLQQFGFGLAAAILIDVTIVRALLVPSAMKLFGRWNWWLPERVARVVRVEPSPLRPSPQPRANTILMCGSAGGGNLAPMRFWATLVLICAASALLAPVADASSGVRFGIQDDAWLAHGPARSTSGSTASTASASRSSASTSTGTRSRRRAASPTGATPTSSWAVCASGDPGGGRLVGSPAGRTAAGRRTSRPAPPPFAAFARSAATRYRWVTQWLIWNEPNQVRWLRPTDPAVYVRQLLNPAYAAIHARTRARRSPAASPLRAAGPGGVSPVDWIRGMRGARLDAYAHHPYPSTTRETPFTAAAGTARRSRWRRSSGWSPKSAAPSARSGSG